MKKNRLAAGALAFAVSVTVCGCGDQIYEMTNEEESVVVHYAAHAVTKFNRRQSEGIKDVTLLKALREQRELEAANRQEQEEPEQDKEQEPQKQDDQPDAGTDGQTQTPSGQTDAGTQTQYVSLKKALGLSGVNASYRSYELVSAYQASQSTMVRANSGKELLVLHVNLKNSGSKTAECNILSRSPSFSLTVNGDLSVNADTTILLNDLGTFEDKIRAGEKVQTVLVFQVPEGAVKSIESMELNVTVDGEDSLVRLVG